MKITVLIIIAVVILAGIAWRVLDNASISRFPIFDLQQSETEPKSNETISTPVSSQQDSQNRTSTNPSSASLDSTAKYIFTGTLMNKVGDESYGGKPAQQFKINVSARNLEPDVTGNVSGQVIVNSTDPNIKLYGSSATYEFYTNYDPVKNWFNIVEYRGFIAD
jgi:hypothetical protein